MSACVNFTLVPWVCGVAGVTTSPVRGSVVMGVNVDGAVGAAGVGSTRSGFLEWGHASVAQHRKNALNLVLVCMANLSFNVIFRGQFKNFLMSRHPSNWQWPTPD